MIYPLYSPPKSMSIQFSLCPYNTRREVNSWDYKEGGGGGGGVVLEEVRWQVDWLVLLQVSVTKMLCILIQIRYTWDKFIAILATFYFSWFLQLVREKEKWTF